MDIDLSSFEGERISLLYKGQNVTISRISEHLSGNIYKHIFTFDESSDIRYCVKFFIPSEAANAYVTLNGKKLLGFFNYCNIDLKYLPDEISKDNRQEDNSHHHETTLTPGEYQKINFRWHKGDMLIFYIFCTENTVSGISPSQEH